ncbi:MAG: hypothetical protein FDZ70_07100, partial [Actinobacteria bacterium]
AIDVPVDPEEEAFRRELAALQAKADALQAQLDDLDRDLSIAAESYNAASERLAQVRAELETTKADLESAQTAYAIQQELLDKRATSIYREGDLAMVELLLDSKSFADLIARVKFMNTMGVHSADLAKQLEVQRDQIARTAAELAAAEQEATSLEFELNARKREIELRISDREEMLRRVDSDILALLLQQDQARRAEEAELLAEILAGASERGVAVVPGTPVETALAYHGVPYLWGGATPAGFDCSGLVLYVFAQHGVQLPHYSGAQFLMGEKVDVADLQPNDVVFFGSPVHHVGIYIGGGYFIHAPRTGDFVKVSLLAARKDFAGARRFAWQTRTAPFAGMDQISPNVNHNVGIQLDR